ncbi:MAG: hypothetical protein RMZ69_15310 [Nostoc sp. ChiQUE01a]|nr:hypothetical protein [Nostoc sp. ChiQUE01a]
MTQNSEKNPNFWTQKHQELCLKYRIKAAYQQFWYWLINYAKPGKVIEVTLHEFNAWVEKQTGLSLSERHLKNLIKRLLDFGLVKLLKKYSWYEFKLIIKPLEWLEPLKKRVEKKSENCTNSSTLATPTPGNTLEKSQDVNQQQHTSSCINTHVSEKTKNEVKQLCLSADIHLPDKCDIYYYPIQKITIALGFLLLKNKRDTIDNRIGWLIDCLRWEYWEEPENKRLLQNKGVITKDSPFYEYYV